MNDPAFSSLTDLSGALRRGDTTSVALTQLYLDRIARFDKGLHAYIAVYAEPALRLAEAADCRRASGLPVHPLNGLPIALKDLCEVEGHVTTAGSAAWKTRKSPFTGAVAERLLAAGMIALGKTHMVEFAFGGWGTQPADGRAVEPVGPADAPRRRRLVERLRASRWRRDSRRRRSAPTPAARCASPPRCAASPASRRRTASISLHGAVPLSTHARLDRPARAHRRRTRRS